MEINKFRERERERERAATSGLVKFNLDGVARGNRRQAGTGWLVRNSARQTLRRFSGAVSLK